MRCEFVVSMLLFLYVASASTAGYVPKTGREFRRLFPHLRRIKRPVAPKISLRRGHKVLQHPPLSGTHAPRSRGRYSYPLIRRSVPHVRHRTEEKGAPQASDPTADTPIFGRRAMRNHSPLKSSRSIDRTVGNNRTPAKDSWRVRSRIISRQRQSIINRCRNIKVGKCCKGWKRQPLTGTCMPFCQESCVHGECDGQYFCKCEEGFTGPLCNIDVNECAKNPCEQGCLNIYGGYRCVCHTGYVLRNDGSCREQQQCEKKKCQYDCYMSGGDAKCSCPKGYSVSPDSRTCKDVNECTERDVKCHDSGDKRRCKNLPGSYVCGCTEGYFYHRYFRRCYDSDECLMEKHNCDKIRGKCINTLGSYRCECREQFAGDGVSCKALSSEYEDALAPDGCHPDATQANGTTEHACVCKPGFAGDGHSCVDVNECVTPETSCAKDSGYCINSRGSYSCKCRPGFRGDGHTCLRALRRTKERRHAMRRH